jgi:DNA-binding transcriptional LysR family regulator
VIDMTKSMQTFVAVVDQGSFASAAEYLNTSTAAVSRHISGLESHLGVRLLYRTTRRLSLTESGQEFYTRSLSILSDLAEAEAVVGQQDLQPKGLLRISAPLAYGIHEFGKLLPEFRLRYPELHLDIDLTDRFVDLVNDGIDVAIRISRSLNSQLVARKISRIDMIMCASPAYLDRKGIPHHPEDLVEHEILSYSLLSSGDNWSFTHKQGEKIEIRIQSKVHASNGDILKILALADGGIIIQPSFIVKKEIEHGSLIPILTDWSMDEFNVYAVYLSRKYLSAKVRSFIDFLVEKQKN